MSSADPTAALVPLGLTEIEAQVYVHLLRESPATGYRVAQALGKPAANVYKALETLAAKGAVVVDEGETRQCRAVPLDEFLKRLEREFATRRARAQQALARLPRPKGDDRIYQIPSRAQVYERARRLLREAEQIVLLDLFPGPAAELKPDIEAAAARGRMVVAKLYAPLDLAGVRVVLEPEAERALARWPGQWLNVVMDGSEFLYSLLHEDGENVVQAVWSASPYLACLFKSGLASELAYTMWWDAMERGASRAELQRIFTEAQTLFAVDTPGYVRLLRGLGLDVDESTGSRS